MFQNSIVIVGTDYICIFISTYLLINAFAFAFAFAFANMQGKSNADDMRDNIG